MNSDLKKLLVAAKNSNGGGIWESRWPATLVRAARSEGYITDKKGQDVTHKREDTLLVITAGGRAALDHDNEGVRALVNEEGKRSGTETTFTAGSAPWD